MYCTPEDLKKYLYEKYLAKIEELSPGMAQSHIAGVCAEIDDALRPRFRLPLVNAPETIRRIAAVKAAFRCVGSITTMMNTEAASSNEWIPLQIQYKEVCKQLEEIAAGKMDVGLEALGNEPDDLCSGIVTKGGKQRFGEKFWKRF
jgi:Mu-like prophage protein gp36